MRRVAVTAALVLVLTAGWLGPGLVRAEEPTAGNLVLTAKLTGAVSPAMAQLAARVIKQAEEAGAKVVVFQLDTPGGLDGAMRLIVQSILNSKVPVVVYVSPHGARAASAGLMITLAGHVAAMAPGTNIGAASPVTAGGKDVPGTMAKKVTNDMAAYVRALAHRRGRNADWAEKAVRKAVSLSAVEAAAEGVVDLVVPTQEALLDFCDGRRIDLASGRITMETKGARIRLIEPTVRDKVLGAIADPSLAYMLFMLGLIALYFELSHPGAVLPGVVGAISFILAFFAFQTLSVNMTGVLLLVVAAALFLLEIYVTSYGLLAFTGLGCLILGSIMLFDDSELGPQLSYLTIIPTLIVATGFFVTIIFVVVKAQRGKRAVGSAELVGREGRVSAWSEGALEGQIFIRGEIWRARSETPLVVGRSVRVTGGRGLTVFVEPAALPPEEDS